MLIMTYSHHLSLWAPCSQWYWSSHWYGRSIWFHHWMILPGTGASVEPSTSDWVKPTIRFVKNPSDDDHSSVLTVVLPQKGPTRSLINRNTTDLSDTDTLMKDKSTKRWLAVRCLNHTDQSAEARSHHVARPEVNTFSELSATMLKEWLGVPRSSVPQRSRTIQWLQHSFTNHTAWNIKQFLPRCI